MRVPVDQLIGQLFGSYRLEHLLGSGSLSSVFAASKTASTQSLDQSRSVMVTVFTLPAACEGRARERFMTRFQQEAQRLVGLSHPNIVPVYDFGEQFGYPYLVTPLTDGNSLSLFLKQSTYYRPRQTLAMLQQMAAALDYAHQNGIVHGSLKLSNVLLVGDQPQQQLHIAGFGLARLLEMRGVGYIDHSYSHLFSVAGTLLVNPTYLAPEVIKGQVADARADVYALGIIVFELLCGRPPFVNDDPFVVAQQQLEAHRPSLQEVCPNVSEDLIALDLVLQRSLERDPAHRLSSAGKLANAFKRALNVLEEAEHSAKLPARQTQTVAPAGSWLVGSAPKEDAWMGVPATTSAKLPALDQAKDRRVPLVSSRLPDETGKWRGVPHFSSQLASVQPKSPSSLSPQGQSQQVGKDQPAQQQNNSYGSETKNRSPRRTTDEVSALHMHEAVYTIPSAFAKATRATDDARDVDTNLQPQNSFATCAPSDLQIAQAAQKERKRKNSREMLKKPEKQNIPQEQNAQLVSVDGKQQVAQEKEKQPRRTRRAILMTSGVVVACVLGFEGMDLLNGLRGQGQKPVQEANTVKKASKTSVVQPNTMQQPNNANTTANNANRGMLLGNKNTPLNSSKTFTNPADQKPSILVRLPSGAFVAYERACTHRGVLVNYDPATQKLVCPLHHSVFDPANKAAVVSGPAPSALPLVAVQVLPDGSVVVS